MRLLGNNSVQFFGRRQRAVPDVILQRPSSSRPTSGSSGTWSSSSTNARTARSTSAGRRFLGGSNSTRSGAADYNNLGGSARAALIGWARAAAAAAGHDLSPFYSTVACTNLLADARLVLGAVGQTAAPAALGVVAQGLTPTPAVLGQEMGHVYGLEHSRRDGTTTDYTDPWT